MVARVWSDQDDAILAGDLTAALAYATPAGGAVVTPVAPIGLRDREAQTVSFTTSLGFGRKLDRIKANPRVALAYHAREHGYAAEPRYVLVQGTATYDVDPDRDVLEQHVRPASARFMGKPRTGLFWDRWLSAYYADRVLVTVQVQRVLTWPDLACTGDPATAGAPLADAGPASQPPPANGVGPRVDVSRAAKRIGALGHLLLGYIGADGYPLVVAVRAGSVSAAGVELSGPLPGGQRRAGLLAHRYQPQLIGLESRQWTGWLADDSTYAPHTETGFRAPANKTVLLLANGYMARRGLKQARAGAAKRRRASDSGR
jgi:hypothetical protein